MQLPVETKLAVNSQHLSTLDESNAQKDVTNKKVNGAENSNSRVTCSGECKQQEETNEVKSCDDLIKQQIIAGYTAQVTAENNKYATELKAKQNLAETSGATDLKSLSAAHQKMLSDLATALKTDVSKLYCTL